MSDVDSELAALRRELEARGAEFATRRYTHSSPDGLATAVVDGNGRLITITLAPGATRGPHPEAVGHAIARAVNLSRLDAAQASRTLVNETLRTRV
jgi:DNA-binding protein YbaB